MKILIVSQYFYPETFRVNILAKVLAAKGHTVKVLTGYPQYPQGKLYKGYGFHLPYQKEWNQVYIERVKVLPRGKTCVGMLLNCISFVWEGKKWVKQCREKFDAVYVFEVSPVTVGLPAIEYKRKFGTPVYFNVQDLWPENVEEVLGIKNRIVLNWIHYIVDKIYKESDYILCASQGFVKQIAKRRIGEEKLLYWPQFCEKPDYNKLKKPTLFQEEEECKLVFAGNIGEAQGLDLLVEAVERLKEEKIKIYLVGDGRARKKLEQLIEKKGLQKKIIFVGRVSEKEADAYIRNADGGYLSFKNTPLFDLTIPAKLQSYLACGIPVLAAAGGESARIVKEAACGLVADRSAEGVEKMIKEFLRMPLEKKEHMKKQAESYFEENFEMGRLIAELEEIMELKNKEQRENSAFIIGKRK